MEIRAVNVEDDSEFARYYAVMRDAELEGRPNVPLYTEVELRAVMTGDVASEIFTPYAGFEAGELVAAGLTVRSDVDNLDKADVFVAVAPLNRRRGLGGELLAYLIDRCRELGRSTILANAMLPDGERETHPYRRFAEKHGFALANVEIRRVLELPVADSQLAAWAAECAPHHADYRIETYRGDVPEQLIPSLCHVMNQLGLDSPTGDIDVEARAITPEIYQQREERSAASHKETVRTVAIDPTGEVVGFSSIAVPLLEADVVYQYGTLVRRDHRGHRLGLAMKAANLRAVQSVYPDRTRVDTCNAETNGPMVEINARMGFTAVEVVADFQRMLNPTTQKTSKEPTR